MWMAPTEVLEEGEALPDPSLPRPMESNQRQLETATTQNRYENI